MHTNTHTHTLVHNIPAQNNKYPPTHNCNPPLGKRPSQDGPPREHTAFDSTAMNYGASYTECFLRPQRTCCNAFPIRMFIRRVIYSSLLGTYFILHNNRETAASSVPRPSTFSTTTAIAMCSATEDGAKPSNTTENIPSQETLRICLRAFIYVNDMVVSLALAD